MSTDRRDQMPVSEAELLAMTADLEEMHQATLPVMRDALAEWTELSDDLKRGTARGFSRRRFLVGGGVAAVGGLVLAACGSSSKSGGGSTTTTVAGNGNGNNLTGDLAVVALAASLENLAVGTYQAGIDAVQKGKLGAVPPAVTTFATTAQAHHKAHAAAWNAVLTQAGKPVVTGVDKTVQDGLVTPTFAKVKDVGGLARLALELENVAAATYLSAIANVSSAAGIQTAATIEPVELQHAAILNFVLGNYPVPDSFTKSDIARATSDAIA